MLSLYQPGHSLLHRLPAGGKLLALSLFGLLLFLVRDPLLLGAAAAGALLLLLHLRLPARLLLRQLAVTLLLLAFLVLANGLLVSWEEARVVGLRLLALVAAATAVTYATRPGDIIAALQGLLRPFGRRGERLAFTLGLALALVLRFIPEVLFRIRELREAMAARGIQGRPLRLIVPLAIRLLHSADEVGLALEARGFPPDFTVPQAKDIRRRNEHP